MLQPQSRFRDLEIPYEFPVVDPTGMPVRHESRTARARIFSLDGKDSLTMIFLPGSPFQMGTARGPGNPDERPQHLVSPGPFWMAKDLVTQEQWRIVIGHLPHCRFHGNTLPVENVRFGDAVEFCRRLSKVTGLPFRLPAEAEWEYACRAGTSSPFSYGETLTTNLANYCGDHTFLKESPGVYRHTTTPGGMFPPNPFGLNDMHGNLWEMCADLWHPDYSGAPFNSQAWTSSGERGWRVARGGSWHETPANCRSAVRLRLSENEGDDVYGFRVVFSPVR